MDFKKDIGLKVNGNSDKEIKEGGGGDECVIHHWGPIPFTGRVSACRMRSCPFYQLCSGIRDRALPERAPIAKRSGYETILALCYSYQLT